MKKWSTSWTSNTVVSHQEHLDIASKVQTMNYEAASDDDSSDKTFFSSFIKPPAEPEIIFQGHTKEEVDVARQEGYDSGYKTGLDDGVVKGKQERFEIDQTLSVSLSDLGQSITNILSTFNSHVEQTRSDVFTLAYSISRKVAGEALDQHAEHKIQALVDNCMEYIITEPAISITLHPQMESALIEHLQKHVDQTVINDSLHILTDATMSKSDCIIEWKDGGASHDSQAKWALIEKVLGQNIAEPEKTLTQDKPKPEEPSSKNEPSSLKNLLKQRASDGSEKASIETNTPNPEESTSNEPTDL